MIQYKLHLQGKSQLLYLFFFDFMLYVVVIQINRCSLIPEFSFRKRAGQSKSFLMKVPPPVKKIPLSRFFSFLLGGFPPYSSLLTPFFLLTLFGKPNTLSNFNKKHCFREVTCFKQLLPWPMVLAYGYNSSHGYGLNLVSCMPSLQTCNN